MAVETVQGKDITLHFDGGKCIHARHCVLGRPDVFVPGVEGEWIHPDAAPAEEIVRIAQACPSGAITYDRHDGGPAEAPPLVNTARVRENGPLALHGELQLQGEAIGTRATLCRCGASKAKPFCDGSHAAAGYAMSGEPATRQPKPLEARNGPVNLEPQPNGPLKVTGNLEVVSGTGRTIDKVTQAWFCRCGQSKKPPYCDGSHKAAGFVAP